MKYRFVLEYFIPGNLLRLDAVLIGYKNRFMQQFHIMVVELKQWGTIVQSPNVHNVDIGMSQQTIRQHPAVQYEWNKQTEDRHVDHQVCCIYTAQGLEFDYIGLIFWDDLYYDEFLRDWKSHKKIIMVIHSLVRLRERVAVYL